MAVQHDAQQILQSEIFVVNQSSKDRQTLCNRE